MSRTTRILTPLLLLAFTLALVLAARHVWNRLPVPTIQPLADGSPEPWRSRFERAYRLEPGEVARLVPPPYPPERDQFIKSDWRHNAPNLQHCRQVLYFDDQRGLRRWSFSVAPGGIYTAIDACSQLTSPHLEIADSLKDVRVAGDWVVRDLKTTPLELRMQAAQEILRSVTRRPIVVEKVTRRRLVLVVDGDYRFIPLGAAKDKRAVHLYCKQIEEPNFSGGGSGDFPGFLNDLESLTRRIFINKSPTPTDTRVVYKHHPDTFRAYNDSNAAHRLLANVSKQTNLTFTPETRDVQIWRVHERP